MMNEQNDKNDLDLTPIEVLSRDLKQAAATLSKDEARYLVDLYYQFQDLRMGTNNQIRAMSTREPTMEPTMVFQWAFSAMQRIENNIKIALDKYTDAQPMGQWAKGVLGIGPVLSAGLLAHIEIDKVRTVGGIWRFAGLDPTQKWGKGEKRPWNAKLKVLTWKIGESFVKVSGNEKSLYGALYVSKKAALQKENDTGQFAEQAKQILAEKKIDKKTEAYKHLSSGKLPPAQIHSRAKRWVVKIFLYHWFAEAYRNAGRGEPPKPYVIAHLNHVDFIEDEQSWQKKRANATD